MKQMGLGLKLMVFFLLVGLIPFGISSVVSLSKSSNALSDAAYDQLKGMREIKKNQIKNFFHERQNDMQMLISIVRDQLINSTESGLQTRKQAISIIRSEAEAVYKFTNSWQGNEEDLKDLLASIEVGKTGYIWGVDYDGNYVVSKNRQRDGENILGAKDSNNVFFIKEAIAKTKKLQGNEIDYQIYPWKNKGETDARDKVAALVSIPEKQWVIGVSVYFDELMSLEALKKNNRRNLKFFDEYVEAYGYSDLFIIEKDGLISYTVSKEADYKTNIIKGKYSNSGLGKLVKSVFRTKEYGIADFEPYAASNNEPCAFIAQPVVLDGKVEKIVALQLSLDSINSIMQQREGMGKTGETYLVGLDKLMRSDSFLDPTHHSVKASFANPSAGSVDTEAVRLALSGRENTKIISDYNGNPALSAFTPLKVGHTTWALIAEIDESEAFAAVKTMKWLMIMLSIVSVLAIVGIAFLITRSITKPINAIAAGMSEGANQVAAASAQVSSASHSLAEGASHQAASIEETSSSMEEMSSMTKKNTENAGHADGLMKNANQKVKIADESMEQLIVSMEEISKASEETSKIIRTIDEIAFQTNLLALNAAVEAARAGEAGAGFAVVAEEVRNLAMRSAGAAKNTSELIESIVNKINDGSQLVTTTNDAFSLVVESSIKVGGLIAEISEASREQSNGIEQVNLAITDMDKVVQKNAANAEESASASEEMNGQAEQLKSFTGKLVQLVTGKTGQSAGTERIQTIKSVSHYSKPSASGKETMLRHNAKEIRPEQVIPFDDDDDDFESF